jgi:NAD(P)H-hydrate repair Nnr-like enzyme with NAD(P)H-hydrate dehydratase domain
MKKTTTRSKGDSGLLLFVRGVLWYCGTHAMRVPGVSDKGGVRMGYDDVQICFDVPNPPLCLSKKLSINIKIPAENPPFSFHVAERYKKF